MGRHCHLIIGVLLLASSLQAQTKSADQAKIDLYLDRARTEIAKWPGPDADRFAQIPSMHDVGTLLMYARGNEQDRMVVSRLHDMPIKVSSKMSPANRALSEQAAKLTLRVAFGERRTLIAEVDRLVEAEKPVLGSLSSVSVYWGLIGEKDRCLSGITTFNSKIVASILLEAGQIDIARAVIDRAEKVDEPTRSTRRDKCYLEFAYIRGGIPAMLEQIPCYKRIDDRIDALQECALRLAEAGRSQDGQVLLNHALAAWDALPEDHYPPRELSTELFDAGYVEHAQTVFDKWIAQSQRGNSAKGWWYWSGVARGAIVLSRPQLLEEATKELRTLAEISDPERPEDQVDAGYALAAALVLRGEHDAALEAFDTARKLAPEADLDASESFWRIADAMHRTGDHNGAMALQRKHLTLKEPGDLDFELGRYVEHLIREKQYEVAWKECDGFERLWNLSQIRRLTIAIQLIRAGREVRALELIDSLSSPTERAALYLFIARDLAGTRMLGTGNISFANR